MKQAPYNFVSLIVIGLFITSVSLFTGCKNTQKPSAESDSEIPFEEEPGTDKIEELSGYPVPNSYEVTQLIYESGARYNLHISNGPEKAGDYITQRDKVLNLGVYAADLAYATTYMMKQATLDYLEASKTLIDDLGISTTFNVNYADRVEANIDNRDSLISIVGESFDDTWEYMLQNKQDVMARLVVVGSWIEGFYLTSKVAADADDNTAFLEALARQKVSLGELIDILGSVKKAEEVAEIYEALVDMNTVYDGVGDTLTEEQFKSLSEKIEALRASIV
jgi:hypothetical protein